jgi:hypothetical protein
MEPLERELQDALRREEPSGDFTARVLARVEQEKHRQSWWSKWFATPRLRWVTAMVLCVVLAGGVVYEREQVRRAEGEAAREQVMLALRIAGTKVKFAQARVQQISDRASRRDQ